MRDYDELVKRLKYSDDNCNAEHNECPAECDSAGYTIFLEAADAIEELLRWRGHSFLRWEKENYKTPPTEVFHDRYYDAMQVVHAICNANPPDGVDQEMFMECLAAVFREIEELPTIKFPPREATP